MGVWEILLIFLVVLLLFGARRLPEIGSSLGKGIREFKGSLREIENELKVPEERKDSESRARRSGGEGESMSRRLSSELGSKAESESAPRRLSSEARTPSDPDESG